jgi:hypothetical protein
MLEWEASVLLNIECSKDSTQTTETSSPKHISILTRTFPPCQWHSRQSNSQYSGWSHKRYCVYFNAEWRCARLDFHARVWMLEWEASVLLNIECSKDITQTMKTSSPKHLSVLTRTSSPCQWHWKHPNSQYSGWRLLPDCVEFNAEWRGARLDLRVRVWMLEWEASISLKIECSKDSTQTTKTSSQKHLSILTRTF